MARPFWPVLLAHLCKPYLASFDLWEARSDETLTRPGRYCYDGKLFAHSERDIVVMAACARYYRFSILVAEGRDGDWTARGVPALGLDVHRGSSLRGGSRGLLALLRQPRESARAVAVCVDGPLGPVGLAKPGIILLARRSGLPIVAVGAAARRRLVFHKSWSRLFLPWPFTRVVAAEAPPLLVPADASRAQIKELAEELSLRLRLAREKAEEIALGPGRRALAGSKPCSPPQAGGVF